MIRQYEDVITDLQTQLLGVSQVQREITGTLNQRLDNVTKVLRRIDTALAAGNSLQARTLLQRLDDALNDGDTSVLEEPS